MGHWISEKLLRRRLFWIVSGILPLIVFAISMLVFFIQQQENAIQRLLHEAVGNAAFTIERSIDKQIALLEGLAASRALDDLNLDAFRLDAQRHWDRHPEWRTLILTDKDKPIFNLYFPPGKPITPLRDPDSLQQVWESGRPFVGNYAHGYVAIRVPVIRQEQVRLTLVAPTQPQYFAAALRTTKIPLQWGYVLVGSDNIVIAASSDISVKAGESLPPTFEQNGHHPLFSDQMRFSAPAAIDSAGWRIFIFSPAAAIEMPFTKTRIALLFAGGVALLTTIILVLVLSSSWHTGQEAIHLRKEIEERNEAQKALYKSEQRFRSLVENSPGAIFIQMKSRFAYLNPAAVKLFGADQPADLVGQPVIEFFHPDDRDSVIERIHILNEDRKPVPRVLEKCLQMDGTPIDVDVSAVPYEFDGNFGALVFLRDVTAFLKTQSRQKELEDQLHQAQKIESVGRLAGGVAHDYNNMLSVILGYAELAMEKVDLHSDLHEDLSEIFAAATRSADITRQLLAFARQQTIMPILLDLNDTVESMLNMLRRLITENIELIWRPKADLWKVKMDPSQINQILANLCVNARDAITNVGRIVIETNMVTCDEAYCASHADFQVGEYVILSVSDNGHGMDKETLEKVFEPFFTTKQVGAGTGLGLATIYGIVKQNNGFINVYSEPGNGSAFKIFLPRYGGGTNDGASLNMKPIAIGHGEMVLVVEDEKKILELTAKMLTALGYDVLLAESPTQALQLAQAHAGKISLLISDVVMPEMNGRELAQRLQGRYPNLKYMFMSGYTADIIAYRGIIEDGVNFIQKPFSKQELAEKLEAVLEKSEYRSQKPEGV